MTNTDVLPPVAIVMQYQTQVDVAVVMEHLYGQTGMDYNCYLVEYSVMDGHTWSTMIDVGVVVTVG